LQHFYLSDEKRRLFLESSSFAFLDLIEIQIRRMLDSNCSQMLETPVLDFLKEWVFRNEQLLSLFDQSQFPLIDYIKALLDKLSKENDQIQAKLRKV
jgi:hypothetical protein